jgi:DNA mismatch repair protein MutS2
VRPHAFRVLELEAALERVATRASSELGRRRVLELRPHDDRDRLVQALATVQETAELLEADPRWAPPPLPDAHASLKRLALEGSVLDAAQLSTVGSLLASGRLLRDAVAQERHQFPLLWDVCRQLHADPKLEDAIARTVDPGGQVLDTASRELRRIRSGLAQAHSRIVRRLEQYLGTLPDRHRVSDASVTIRGGRYVVPVRREGRRDVGGIVHDESATGATLFMEPPLAIQLMNDLKELERAEAREIHRILTERTEALRPSLHGLQASLEAGVVFDTLYARARTARDWGAIPPELLPAESQELRIVDGRHPLLLGESGPETVVPFFLELVPGERAMVVSGPNTGGKTVFLKALGLISALAQCGVVPPVGAGSRLPVFGEIFADIGDEQSISESLSTFSAHLANLRQIVERAGPDTLVLIDEMGTGTDPAEGVALARSVLETLVDRQALCIVTSHLGALKRLDLEGSGIVNASLEFDPDRMEPTYVLAKGRPGRSYGLAIARKLGFPAPVLDRAEVHLSEGDARLDDLLEKLQREERAARELADSLADEKAGAERLAAELAGRERQLREREKTAERRAHEEARRLLMEAREEVEAAIREVREAATTELAEVGRQARRRVEEAAARHRASAEPAEARPLSDVSVGDRVRIHSSGTEGEVVELREGRALVSTAGLRMQVPLGELAVVRTPAPTPRPSSGGGWSAPEIRGTTEIDLRGLRVDEVQLELERGLDGAILGDFEEVRIIHGKGTGAVRQRVQELLGLEARVKSFRLGEPGEGGAGVTVAVLG